MLKKNEEAIQCYDKTIKLDSDEAIFYPNKASSFYALEKIWRSNSMVW